MKKVMRKLNRYLANSARRRRPFKAGGPLERLTDVEVRHDVLAQEVALLRAELQMSSVRQQALVDYYESRIDRIYARLSADVAQVQGVQIHIEQDADVDGRLVSELRRVLKVREDYLDIPVAAILSDHLAAGELRGPLTLQGFRINRAVAGEAGDRIVVSPLEKGSKTAVYGPYKRLVAGRYAVSLCGVLSDGEPVRTVDVRFDIYCPTLDTVVAEGQFQGAVDTDGRFVITLDVDWPADKAGHELEFRVHQRGATGFGITGFDIVAADKAG